MDWLLASSRKLSGGFSLTLRQRSQRKRSPGRWWLSGRFVQRMTRTAMVETKASLLKRKTQSCSVDQRQRRWVRISRGLHSEGLAQVSKRKSERSPWGRAEHKPLSCLILLVSGRPRETLAALAEWRDLYWLVFVILVLAFQAIDDEVVESGFPPEPRRYQLLYRHLTSNNEGIAAERKSEVCYLPVFWVSKWTKFWMSTNTNRCAEGFSKYVDFFCVKMRWINVRHLWLLDYRLTGNADEVDAVSVAFSVRKVVSQMCAVYAHTLTVGQAADIIPVNLYMVGSCKKAIGGLKN